MTKIETRLHKQNADDIVGLKIILYDNLKNELDKIMAIDKIDYNNFVNVLSNHIHNYIALDLFDDIIEDKIEAKFSDLINYNNVIFTLEDNGDLYIEY